VKNNNPNIEYSAKNYINFGNKILTGVLTLLGAQSAAFPLIAMTAAKMSLVGGILQAINKR
jgi:hypothetical protein